MLISSPWRLHVVGLIPFCLVYISWCWGGSLSDLKWLVVKRVRHPSHGNEDISFDYPSLPNLMLTQKAQVNFWLTALKLNYVQYLFILTVLSVMTLILACPVSIWQCHLIKHWRRRVRPVLFGAVYWLSAPEAEKRLCYATLPLLIADIFSMCACIVNPLLLSLSHILWWLHRTGGVGSEWFMTIVSLIFVYPW